MSYYVISQTARGWEQVTPPHPSALAAAGDLATLMKAGYAPRAVVDEAGLQAATCGAPFTPVCTGEPGSIDRYLMAASVPKSQRR